MGTSLVGQFRRLRLVPTIPFGLFFWFVPKPESSCECGGVVAQTASWRQCFQLLCISAAEDHVLCFERTLELFRDNCHLTPPFFLSQPFQSPDADVVFKG